MTISVSDSDRVILDRDFSRAESRRPEIELYVRAGVGRPGVAFVYGAYQTESERREWIAQGCAIRLSRPRPSLDQSITGRLYRTLTGIFK